MTLPGPDFLRKNCSKNMHHVEGRGEVEASEDHLNTEHQEQDGLAILRFLGWAPG